ncbi:hypothetical protein [Breznakiella homolactica]|uniref:Uncharacterized protein n=1 Tax=Breznakiella homolactica TaxID=2798577 RepID=A0A7T7XRF1_9SPIR|nr:hypothetical protein [Breznakiella homolactica]QQO11062.1 hypothetical protein JFL75_09140 [Breznakiella homolactica]
MEIYRVFCGFPARFRSAGFFFLLCCAILALCGCGEPLLSDSFRLELPVLPVEWTEILGRPRWRIEWIGRDGTWRQEETDFPENLRIGVMAEWASPVAAYPYWPEAGLNPGDFYPAGALFPFDREGGAIVLTWDGGVPAVFYRELARLDPDTRKPEYFDWPRFREVLASPETTLRTDPWLADWRLIAEKTVQSGFDRRRIVSRYRGSTTAFPPDEGPWACPSPFAPEMTALEEGGLELPTAAGIDTYVSYRGIIRCSEGVWAWFPRP